jgi:hypothetical protein
MLEPLLGSRSAERTLVYLLARQEGYAREIARYFGADPDSIQKQLVKFEAGGILVAKPVGRARVYSFNPRYPFLKPLKALLEKAITFYSKEEKERLLLNRRRPTLGG